VRSAHAALAAVARTRCRSRVGSTGESVLHIDVQRRVTADGGGGVVYRPQAASAAGEQPAPGTRALEIVLRPRPAGGRAGQDGGEVPPRGLQRCGVRVRLLWPDGGQQQCQRNRTQCRTDPRHEAWRRPQEADAGQQALAPTATIARARWPICNPYSPAQLAVWPSSKEQKKHRRAGASPLHAREGAAVACPCRQGWLEQDDEHVP
jgi:hypothetical protein